MVKVSVIIPVYNVEPYLRECLDSVINQTLKDIEIICVNDGSPDNSLKILQEYAAKDSRIIVIDRENRGVAESRNEAIRKAAGKFVCFMDPDDFYPDTDILEILYLRAKENNVLIAGGEFVHFNNNTKLFNPNFGKSFEGYLFEKSKIMDYKDYQFDYGFHRFIYEREFLIKNNIFFPNYKRFQDPPFFVKALILAKRFYAVSKPTYAYRHAHKTIKLDKLKVYDCLCGISDNLQFAKQYKLDKLAYYTKTRFEQHYSFIVSNLSTKARLKILSMPRVRTWYFGQVLSKIIQLIFSIKSSQSKPKRKVITILGIKIRVKRR